jgi:alpha-beta hydrolase superfamily lysophospholipase
MRITKEGWGSRSQIAGTAAELRDVLGNRDGLWGNEAEPAGETGTVFDRNPLAKKLERFVSAGASVQDELRLLSAFRAEVEAAHGPVTDLDLSRVGNGELFAAQKAVALARYGREPGDVVDGFVSATGSVDGQRIEAREIFSQRWKPHGPPRGAPPSGKVLVLSPGFQETGRSFYEQIDALNRRGHDVVVMDHQWAGHSDGAPGGLDRGYGVARDVAAVLAHAQTVVDTDYADRTGAEVVPVGNSMGGGAGVFAALVLMRDDAIDLDGAKLPVVARAALQAPFLKASDNLLNDTLALASKLPFVNRLQVPAAGLPPLNHDEVGAEKGAQSAVLDDVRAQLSTMTRAQPDLDDAWRRFEAGGLDVKLFVVHGDDDPLADAAMSRRIAELAGERARVKIIDSDNHVLQQTPGEQDHLVDGIDELLRG